MNVCIAYIITNVFITLFYKFYMLYEYTQLSLYSTNRLLTVFFVSLWQLNDMQSLVNCHHMWGSPQPSPPFHLWGWWGGVGWRRPHQTFFFQPS